MTNNKSLRPKKVFRFSGTFLKQQMHAGRFLFLSFRLGTFLDILVCLTKQDNKVIEMQVSSLKQHKQILIYQFSLQIRIPYICSLGHNLVKNNSQISEKTPVSCIFTWVEKRIPTE